MCLLKSNRARLGRSLFNQRTQEMLNLGSARLDRDVCGRSRPIGSVGRSVDDDCSMSETRSICIRLDPEQTDRHTLHAGQRGSVRD